MTSLPDDVAALIAEWGAPTDAALPGLAEIIARLERRVPRVSVTVGEPLLVSSWREHHDRAELTWRYDIVGQRSGERYGQLRFGLAGDDVPDTPLEAIGLALRLALNAEHDLPAGAAEAFDELIDGT